MEASVYNGLHPASIRETRACVRESLRHGEANAPFMQRSDKALKSKGKASIAVSSKMKGLAEGQTPPVVRSIYDLCADAGADAGSA